jgi:hypothetical protein
MMRSCEVDSLFAVVQEDLEAAPFYAVSVIDSA